MLTAISIEKSTPRSQIPLSGILISTPAALQRTGHAPLHSLSINIQKHNSLGMLLKLRAVENFAESGHRFSSTERGQISVGTEENFRRDENKFPTGRKNISDGTEIYVRRDGNSGGCRQPFSGLETGRRSSTGRQKSKSK